MATAPRTNRPGTMRERPPGSGQWQLRVFAGSDPLTGRPRQVSRTFKGTKAAAGKALAALVTEVSKGLVPKSGATVGQLLDAWLEQARHSQRPRTLYENKRKIEGRIRPVLGALALAKLGADTLDDAYRRWLDDGLSPTTVHKFHRILSASLNQGVKWGWIDRAPTDRASPPSPTNRAMKVPTPAQLSALVTAAEDEDPVLATAIALAALTGVRRGELIALRWSDVDLDVGRVMVARSVTLASGRLHEGPTKTHQARQIALDEVSTEVLRRRWDYMVDLSERAESPLVEDPYVLSYNANSGRPVGPDTFTHRFGALCRKMEAQAAKRAKVSRARLLQGERWPYRFHDLRHFSVTTLIAAGVDVRTVAERHGHAQATMTLNRYAHALPERDRAAAGILGKALSPTRSG